MLKLPSELKLVFEDTFSTKISQLNATADTLEARILPMIERIVNQQEAQAQRDSALMMFHHMKANQISSGPSALANHQLQDSAIQCTITDILREYNSRQNHNPSPIQRSNPGHVTTEGSSALAVLRKKYKEVSRFVDDTQKAVHFKAL